VAGVAGLVGLSAGFPFCVVLVKLDFRMKYQFIIQKRAAKVVLRNVHGKKEGLTYELVLAPFAVSAAADFFVPFFLPGMVSE
jgi:hypothetical protein